MDEHKKFLADRLLSEERPVCTIFQFLLTQRHRTDIV